MVMLLADSATFVLHEPSGECAMLLNQAGSYVLIPRGMRHTARKTRKENRGR